MTTLLEEMGAQIADSLSVLASAATLTHNGTDYAVSVVVEEQDRTANNMLSVDERIVLIFGLTIEPRPRDKLTVGGKAMTVQSVASAAFGAAHRVVVKG